jgi:hypothetical protein
LANDSESPTGTPFQSGKTDDDPDPIAAPLLGTSAVVFPSNAVSLAASAALKGVATINAERRRIAARFIAVLSSTCKQTMNERHQPAEGQVLRSGHKPPFFRAPVPAESWLTF